MRVKSGTITAPDVELLEFTVPDGAQSPLTYTTDFKKATITLPLGMNTANLDFTDGDTFKRFTITDAAVTAASLLNLSIRRPDVADIDDQGWVFVPNVVTIGTGTFDVNVAALVLGEPGINDEGPNETAVLVYSVQ